LSTVARAWSILTASARVTATIAAEALIDVNTTKLTRARVTNWASRAAASANKRCAGSHVVTASIISFSTIVNQSALSLASANVAHRTARAEARSSSVGTVGQNITATIVSSTLIDILATIQTSSVVATRAPGAIERANGIDANSQ